MPSGSNPNLSRNPIWRLKTVFRQVLEILIMRESTLIPLAIDHRNLICVPLAKTDTDTVYPEHLSRFHRRVVPKKRKGGSSRYRTQPITFSEIKEVDEDNVTEESVSCRTTSTQELQYLNEKFELFRRASDVVFYSKEEQTANRISTDLNLDLNEMKSEENIPSVELAKRHNF